MLLVPQLYQWYWGEVEVLLCIDLNDLYACNKLSKNYLAYQKYILKYDFRMNIKRYIVEGHVVDYNCIRPLHLNFDGSHWQSNHVFLLLYYKSFNCKINKIIFFELVQVFMYKNYALKFHVMTSVLIWKNVTLSSPLKVIEIVIKMSMTHIYVYVFNLRVSRISLFYV